MKQWLTGLRGKLLMSAVLPVFAFAILTAMSIHSMNKLGAMLTDAYTAVIPDLDGLGQMGMQRARIGYFIWASLANKENEKARANFIKKAKEAFEEFKKGQAYYEATQFDEEEEKNYGPAREVRPQFYALTESMIAGLEKNDPEEEKRVYTAMNGGEWHVLAIKTQDAIAANMKLYNARSIEGNKIQKEERTRETQLLLLISAVCALSIFAILMMIAYKVSKTVSGIAAGLTDSGNQVSSAITQLSAAGQTLSESATEAAASLEETVASLEEMSSMVKLNSDNAKQAAALSQSSKDSAEQGQREINQLIESMRDISTSSKKIEEIISVIDDIAFQTNLLALNASVEAARAGEHGKGFAVVAEAVRTLAQRSAVAAKDINSLIKESVEKVEKGSTVADRSGEVLANIVNSVKKVSDLNNEISAASGEQTTGIQQISKAMNQLDQGSQANAAGAEEVAASSEEISAQAEQMKHMVANLNQVILGAVPAHDPVEKMTPKKSAPPAAAPKSTNVVPMAKKPAPKHESKPHTASNVIPFDDDESPRKVGTTDGF
ncbi:chemotaxis protein [Bdellovibrio bacteriovorus]|uniref:Chemotaxis protein n=1 Tax=Bdellovibrio bacteriovorus TaxID=959 RepID=A0A150WJZ6_BDEBC|nr:methyl-accepting chemotaxis protein [Bdellovibrio bacteriovorus]KYG64042.1 chemotaxis protein [Bdellovibrio bacteriovorus]